MSQLLRLTRGPLTSVVLIALVLLLQACGGSSSYGGGGGGGSSAPGAPTGLTASAGNQQATLSWTASAGATSYHVKRGTAAGGPYTQVATPTSASYVDTALTNSTKYFYVVSAVNSVGESGNSSEASATPLSISPVPTGLSATSGDKQVGLVWNASAGVASYNVKRGTTTGGPYTTLSSPAGTSYVDMGLTDGAKYYYVVSAVNSAGESGNSTEASATPVAASTNVQVTVDVLANRHPISPYVYGGSYPKDAATIADSGLTVVRWGGNATSTYNWQLHTYNADNDYFFEDFNSNGLGNGSDSDSAQFISDVKTAGSNPLMTMAMLPWVAKTAENNNGHWSFSVAKYGVGQCKTDPFNTDAGNGVKADCTTNITGNDPNDAYFPLLDQPGTGDPANSVYRNQWAAALATAFGMAPHFYNLDNEIDIWGGTHRDIHPIPAAYNELRDVYLTETRNLKTWDPLAIRLGPVSCCWYFYWRSATGNSDTSSHGGVDFLPWWLNEVAWSDAAIGSRSLDIFDIHAYPDGPDTTNFTQAQKQALAVRIYRDWWDPTYASEASYIVNGGFSIEPLDSKPFRIPRIRALLNEIYPGTQFSITEWSAEFAGSTSAQKAADFSTALGDADAYGILGRERVYLASRWTAPDPTTPNPNYLALKLFTNYDGAHHGFGTTSVSATHNADLNLFSSYAALDSTGKTLTMMVVNKDPANGAQVQFALNGFTPSSVVSYTLAATAPTTIKASSSAAWSSTMTFAPYTATLLVITGTTATIPATEWDLNPDTIMVPAGGTVTLQPKITGGTASLTLSSPTSDSGISVALTQPAITASQKGTITITAGNTPGFYHFTVSGSDGVATQVQGGWIVVGKPAATITKTGDNQTGGSLTLTATLAPGSSGGTATGASIFFTTSAGTLSSRIVTTDVSGKASVVLTLPAGTGIVHITVEGPYGLGHPLATFTETSN